MLKLPPCAHIYKVMKGKEHSESSASSRGHTAHRNVLDVLARVAVFTKTVHQFCFRTVSGPEIRLHRHGWSHHGRRSSSLPHHRLHHRDPDCPQGPVAGLHGQSVSLPEAFLHRMCTDA